MESNKKKLFALVVCCAGDSSDCCEAFYSILPSVFSNIMQEIINDEIHIFFFCHNNKIFQGIYVKGPKFLKNKLMDPKEFPQFLAHYDFDGYQNFIIYFSDHGNTKSLLLDIISLETKKVPFFYDHLSKCVESILEKNSLIKIYLFLESCQSNNLLVQLETLKNFNRIAFLGL